MIEKRKDLKYRHIRFIDKKKEKEREKTPHAQKTNKKQTNKTGKQQIGHFTWIYVKINNM